MEDNVGQLVVSRFQQYGDKIMLKILENKQWRSFTGKQANEHIQKIAYALLQEGIEKDDKVGIFSQNMPEWTLADVGTTLIGAVSVPIFATQIADQAKYIMKDANIQILFVGENQQYQETLKIIDDPDVHVRKVVVFSEKVELTYPKSVYYKDWIAQEFPDIIVSKFNYVIKEVEPTDLATIIYTSGTTGEPKGAMITHESILRTLQNHDLRYDLSDEDVSLAFLPLAHVFERAWTYYVFHNGMCNVYNKNPKFIAQAMLKAQPTVMCSVPRLYEKIYFMAMDSLKKTSPGKQKLFNAAIKTGAKVEDRRLAGKRIPLPLRLKHKIYDKLVLSKIRAKMGGKLRFMPCGGSFLSAEITSFFRSVGLPIIIGYGLSETTATVTCSEIYNYKLGSVGKPLPNVQVKISHEDEILVKGDNVMHGYYNKPDETIKVFDKDGWLKTGDAGYMDEEGNLFITDRIKDLIKTSGGKYVAPQLVESVLTHHNLIEQVAVIGEGKPYVSALMTPNFEALENWAKEKGIQFQNTADLVKMPEVLSMYKDLVSSLQIKLSSFEQVKKFKLLPREFSIEENEMTPTFKIKRKVVYLKYAALIDEMYG